MHISVPANSACEFINNVQISPFVSKVQIKVCYIGEQPNRNGTIITKEVASEFGRFLPGSPIVGYYDKNTKDFDSHSRELQTNEKGEFVLVDITKPYGFVDINANIWFQKFIDDGQVEREYLVTEGYIWTGVYEESERIVKNGNNQSLEFDEETFSGDWVGSYNSFDRFFIINEAFIKKLCILGEQVEPCFEGSQIKTQFSLNNLKKNTYELMKKVRDERKKGGNSSMTYNLSDVVEYQELSDKFNDLTTQYNDLNTNYSTLEQQLNDLKEQYAALEQEKENEKTKCEQLENEKNDEKTKCEQAEQELTKEKEKYSALETEYNELKGKYDEISEYKLQVETEKKQEMINSFYMLSDEEKKDVQDNIQNYSLDEIESKLSVICVRNKVNFDLDDGQNNSKGLTYNLNNLEDNIGEDAPTWILSAREVAKEMR